MNLILLVLLNLSLFKFTISHNTTSIKNIVNVIDTKEYYLIISGILLGTLIFLFVAFALLYIRNKKPRGDIIYDFGKNNNIIEENSNEVNNDVIETSSFCEEIFESKNIIKQNSKILNFNEETKSNSSEEFKGFNDEYLEINTINKPKLKKEIQVLL